MSHKICKECMVEYYQLTKEGKCPVCNASPAKENPLDVQVGGEHYKDMPIQPVEFIQRNGLRCCEANIVKYACRHRMKGGKEDVKKIIHYAKLLLELEYNEDC